MRFVSICVCVCSSTCIYGLLPTGIGLYPTKTMTILEVNQYKSISHKDNDYPRSQSI